MLNIFGGVRILRAAHCWYLLAWVADGYWWVLGALLVVIFGMRGGATGASCWWFLFSNLGGVGLSGGIICTFFLTGLAGVE